MQKRELEQARYLGKEVKMWNAELERLRRQKRLGEASPSGSRTPGGDGLAQEIKEVEAIIEGKLAEIQIARKKIVEYIGSVEDSHIRQIMYLRNISCLKWEEIADELGGSAGSVKMAYSRYMRKG